MSTESTQSDNEIVDQFNIIFIDECRTASVSTALAVSSSPVAIYINWPLDNYSFTKLEIATPVSSGASNTNC